METKQRYISITRPESHGNIFCVVPFDGLDYKCEFDGAEEGESVTLTLKLMTKEEFEALGDFEGW